MPTKSETAQRLAREARVRAREAHAKGAAGTKITLDMVEGIANQLICDGRLTADQADPHTVRKAHRIAVEQSYEFGENHLINLSDVPALRLTARDRIELVAAEHGWSAQDENAGVTRIYRKRGHGYLRVYFATTSQVWAATTAQRGLGGGDRRKAEAVIAYLSGDKHVPGLGAPMLRTTKTHTRGGRP